MDLFISSHEAARLYFTLLCSTSIILAIVPLIASPVAQVIFLKLSLLSVLIAYDTLDTFDRMGDGIEKVSKYLFSNIFKLNEDRSSKLSRVFSPFRWIHALFFITMKFLAKIAFNHPFNLENLKWHHLALVFNHPAKFGHSTKMETLIKNAHHEVIQFDTQESERLESKGLCNNFCLNLIRDRIYNKFYLNLTYLHENSFLDDMINSIFHKHCLATLCAFFQEEKSPPLNNRNNEKERLRGGATSQEDQPLYLKQHSLNKIVLALHDQQCSKKNRLP